MDSITENYISQIETSGYELGKVIGQELAAQFVLDEASGLFASGKDDVAILLRSIAKELFERAKQARKEYDAEHKEKRNEAWSVLGEAIGDADYISKRK